MKIPKVSLSLISGILALCAGYYCGTQKNSFADKIAAFDESMIARQYGNLDDLFAVIDVMAPDRRSDLDKICKSMSDAVSGGQSRYGLQQMQDMLTGVQKLVRDVPRR